MKRKKVALYDPFLDTLGGGEKYILSFLKVLEDNGYECNIFWDINLTREIRERLHLSFTNLSFVPNIFKKSSFLEKSTNLREYDLFLYVTDGSYFVSTAKKNIVYAMVPDKKLYSNNLITKLKLLNYHFISHSQFSQQALKNCGITSEVIYPSLDRDFLSMDKKLTKEPIILSVGRFFKHLHSKRHDLMIKQFQSLKKSLPEIKNFRLILAGGLKDEDSRYLEELKNIASDDPAIIFEPNLSYDKLLKLYRKALVYWHFAGYGIDEKAHPELVEHLGIAPLEAMAAGCITMCYAAGGPKELIIDGVNGYLFTTEEELKEKMQKILTSPQTVKQIQESAKIYTNEKFNYETFSNRVKQILL